MTKLFLKTSATKIADKYTVNSASIGPYVLTIDFLISRISLLYTSLIGCHILQDHRHFGQRWSIFLLLLLSFAVFSLSSGPIQTTIAIKSSGTGTAPCSPLFCGKPMPQSIIKSFTPVIDMNNKGYLSGYDFSFSGNKEYVVWTNQTYGKGKGDVYFRKSTNNGANFDTKIKLSNILEGSKLPKLASVGNNVYVAWYDTGVNYNGNANLIFRRSIDGGNTFQNPISLSSTVSHPSFSIAAMGNNVYVLWEDSGNKISFRRSIDGGNTFGNPLTLSSFNTLSLNGHPKMVPDASNVSNIYAVWEQEDSNHLYANIVFVKSTDGGTTFSNPAIVSSGVEDTWAPDLALKGSNIYVAWIASDNMGHHETYFRRSTDGGNIFDSAISIDNNDKSAEYPSIAVNKDNNLIFVVWTDWSIYKKAYTQQIFLRKSSDGGASFGKIIVASPATSNIFNLPPHGSATYPKAIAAANNVFVIWKLDKPAHGEDSFIFRYSDDNGTSFYNSFTVNTATSKVTDEITFGNVQFLYGNNYLHFFWIGNYSYSGPYRYDRLFTRTAGPFS